MNLLNVYIDKVAILTLKGVVSLHHQLLEDALSPACRMPLISRSLQNLILFSFFISHISISNHGNLTDFDIGSNFKTYCQTLPIV